MARTTGSSPGRTLLWLGLIIVLLYGTVAAGIQWSTATAKPKLALDLAGGTQIVLTPRVAAGQGQITNETITDAIGIIRQRVDSTGVSEAAVTSQGGRNIVVELPGDPEDQKETIELVRRSSQMRFRPVLVEQPATVLPAPTPTPAPTDAATPTPTDDATAGTPSAPAPVPTATTNGRAVPQALVNPTTRTLTTQGTPAPSTPAPTGTAPAPGPTATSASDLNQITEEIATRFQALDCSDPSQVSLTIEDDITKPMVTCSLDGTAKYILGPVEVQGSDLNTASAGLVTNSQGVSTGEWGVNLEFNDKGTRQFREVTERITDMQPPQNQFAIVLDGLVISAPRSQVIITDGKAQITGNFTQETATVLANQLKFGALPISFEVQSQEQISALLGSEQLRHGLMAGLIGLLLVLVYSLLQYRALGLVTVASLLIAGVITYGVILLMGWYQGYRLSLPGVAGLIVAIGITADSFIVYFERVRDEVRDGRSLISAVETGWRRARRTILASDAISFLAAIVLYLLAVGGVRGFAFTLGLITLIDVLVVFMFSHPAVSLLARTRFFGGGHKLSGFDAAHLGRTVAYAGRGRVRTPAAVGAGQPTRSSSPQEVPPIEEDALTGASPRRPARSVSGRQTIAERKAAQARERAESGHTSSSAKEI